jgi:predicted transcriptional regulator
MSKHSVSEELLGSKWKIRLIKELINEGEINISALVKRSRSFFKNATAYLDFLKELGIVKEKRFGKVRIVIVNQNSETYVLLKRLLDILDKS